LAACSVTSGALAAGLAFCGGLPIMVATLTAGRFAGLVALLVCSLSLGALFSPSAAALFALVIAIPSAALADLLAGRLAQPRAEALTNAGPAVAAAALYGSGLACVGALLMGSSFAAYDAALGAAIEDILKELATTGRQAVLIESLGGIPNASALLK